jgi:ATP adenylyltransferase
LNKCIFCELENHSIVSSSNFFNVIRDSFPVTHLHTLIIPKRHVETYFDLNQDECAELSFVLKAERQTILELDKSVKAFNIGINAGAEAGQTIFHCHIHLIPRRVGDVEDPRGGVRGVIADKQKY